MIGPPRLNRRNAQIVRSQFALEVALSVLALVGAFLALRLMFKLIAISDRVWTGSLVYGLTDRLVWPLSLLPGSERMFMGEATLKEVTAVALFAMVSLAVSIRTRSRPG